MEILILCVIPMLTFYALLTVNFHMLQLSSYRLERYLLWQKRHISTLFGFRRLFPLITFIAIASLDFITAGSDRVIFTAIALSILQITSLAFFVSEVKRKSKKPLVYTNRIKRLYICATIIVASVLIALNSAYSLLAFLVFPHLIAFVAACSALLLAAPFEHFNKLRYINQAKNKLASMPNLVVIGITGSFGKTSTKYVVHTFLSQKYNVLMTPESYNTPMGVVRTIREKLNGTHDIFVVEMGAKQRGDIKEICDIVKPKYGIITSVGQQHLETFKTIENIADTKFELESALPPDGIIFLNYDNKINRERTKRHHVISYGNDVSCDYQVHDTTSGIFGTQFYVKTHTNKDIYFETRLLGKHNALNITAACAVASELGVSTNEQRMAAMRLAAVPHRLQLITTTKYTIIDDAFNSNPQGARAALDVLSGFSGVKVVITPGMVELGAKQDELNYALGEHMASCCDYILLVGKPEQVEPLKKGALSAKFSEDRLKVFDTFADAIGFVNRASESNWVVLLENDLPDNY